MADDLARGLKFSVTYPDGRGEVLVVDADRVLIGSGAHCEIRLPASEAAVEHVAITMVGEGVHAEARALEPPPTIHGSPFMQSPVGKESVIGVGRVIIRVEVADIVGNLNIIKRKQEKTSPVVILAAILALPLAYYVLFVDPPDERPPPPPQDVPSLFPKADLNCPQAAPDQALAFGLEKKALAEGKRERRPFHVQDGVAAVPLFELASACFAKAGNKVLYEETSTASRALRAAIDEDYRAHQVRLEHALTVGDNRGAQKEVRVLKALTEGLSGPYVVWLSNLERRLSLKTGSKA